MQSSDPSTNRGAALALLEEKNVAHLFEDLRFHNLWPHYFTFACLAFFGLPMVVGLSLAQDPSISYWIGKWGYIPAFIPVYICALHMLHLRLGPPKMVPVILGSVVPCFVNFLVFNIYLQGILSVPSVLASSDCTTFSMKQDVHRSWMSAAAMYEDCVNRTARERGLSYNDTFKIIRLQDCREWQEDEARQRPTLLYLQNLEEECGCAGWCWPARPLWTYGKVKDKCSTTAAALLSIKAADGTKKMLFLSLVGFIVSIGGLGFVNNQIKEAGLTWARF